MLQTYLFCWQDYVADLRFQTSRFDTVCIFNLNIKVLSYRTLVRSGLLRLAQMKAFKLRFWSCSLIGWFRMCLDSIGWEPHLSSIILKSSTKFLWLNGAISTGSCLEFPYNFWKFCRPYLYFFLYLRTEPKRFWCQEFLGGGSYRYRNVSFIIPIGKNCNTSYRI